MKKEELRITIVGAGIGGLMAAIALIQKGFNVQIYEKADELKDPHIFVTLFPNAMMILNNFGMAEEVYSKGNAVELFTLSTHTGDRKSTRLNSSHLGISYAVFCLKK